MVTNIDRPGLLREAVPLSAEQGRSYVVANGGGGGAGEGDHLYFKNTLRPLKSHLC